MLTLKSQNGAALVVGLIVLMVMTMIGISSMSSTTTELKIASNLQTYNNSFQAADSVLMKIIDPNNPEDGVNGINWGLATAQSFPDFYISTNGRLHGDVNAVYADCQLVPTGYSLTQDVTMKGIVHDVTVVGRYYDSTGATQVSSNTQLNGVQTIRPGCP